MRSTNARSGRRRFCLQCAAVARQGQTQCASCGHDRFTSRWIQPRIQARLLKISPPFPFHRIKWPEGGTVSVSAREGVGKSRSVAQLNRMVIGPNGLTAIRRDDDSGLYEAPNGAVVDTAGWWPLIGAWISTEQDPAPVDEMFRSLGIPCPPIYSCDPLDPINSTKEALRQLVTRPGAVTVLDSSGPLGAKGAVEVMNLMVQDCLATGRRGLIIHHQNKENEIMGSVTLNYIPELTGEFVEDEYGRRLFRNKKSRHNLPTSTYFAFNNKGQIIPAEFTQVAHSIEGKRSQMELVPYGFSPMKGSCKRADLLDALADAGVLPDFVGYASCATASAGTPSGFLEPPDAEVRYSFAADHGLKRLTIDMALAAIDQAEDVAEDEERDR